MTVAATLLDSRYSLDEEIGAGGYCEVWRATDTVLARPVAVKLLHASYAHQPEALARFKAEARHAGALTHANIARVYDYGEPACGRTYLVMELIRGPSLDTVLADGPLDVARTMDIVAQIAAGLYAAHRAGLVHRDIKPANILFTCEGTVRITDFGIAHAVGSAPLTATGTVLGTPGYIAPERIAGAQGGEASDLYALGIVAFECLAGRPPFSGPPLEVALAHRDRPLPPLPGSLPTDVEDLVMALTAKDPVWRPARADEVAHQARRLRDRLISGAAAHAAPFGVPPAITDARKGQGRPAVQFRPAVPFRPAVQDRTCDGRPSRLRSLCAGALVALAALTCLMLLSASGFATASHPAARPSSAPPQAAPPVAQSPRTASPAAQPPSLRPAATPNTNTNTGVVAAVSHAPFRHPAPRPGRHSREHRPSHGNAAHHDPGNGPGSARGHGHAPGNGPGRGPGTATG